MIIKSINVRPILDSNGYFTLAADFLLADGKTVTASAGLNELADHQAFSGRDGRQHTAFALANRPLMTRSAALLNSDLVPQLCDKEITPQELDKKLLAWQNEHELEVAANSVLPLSLAGWRAAAGDEPLYKFLSKTVGTTPDAPRLIINLFNGGRYGDTNLDFEEYLILPTAKKISEQIKLGTEVYHHLGIILAQAGFDTDVGSEGGYAPDIVSSAQALELIQAAALAAGYHSGRDYQLGLDLGANQLYDESLGHYVFSLDRNYFSARTMLDLYYAWLEKYPIGYLEDGLAEDDDDGWQAMTKALAGKVVLAGDELFLTKENKLRERLNKKIGTATVARLAHNATVSQLLDFLILARKHGYELVLSQDYGETNDDFIVDLAVAIGAEYLKVGSLSRGERVVKYNRLLAIDN